MKTKLILIAAILTTNLLIAQNNVQTCIPMIGETAPSFEGQSTMGKISFPKDYFSKWKILLSHPGDFTAVCSTELITLASMSKDFDKLNTALVVVSTDGINSHLEWIRSMESIKYKDIAPVKFTFPLVSDISLEISKKYGMIHPNYNSTKDIRAVFIIDNLDKVRAIFYYPSTTGRNMDEIKRTLMALQENDNNNVITPANWKPGDDAMISSPATSLDAEKLANKKDDNLYSLTWYMWFKKARR